MKTFAASLAALSLLVPSIAMANAAQSLSLSNAVVQPVRASAPKGKTAAISTPILVVAALIVIGGGILLLDDDDKSDSN